MNNIYAVVWLGLGAGIAGVLYGMGTYAPWIMGCVVMSKLNAMDRS